MTPSSPLSDPGQSEPHPPHSSNKPPSSTQTGSLTQTESNKVGGAGGIVPAPELADEDDTSSKGSAEDEDMEEDEDEDDDQEDRTIIGVSSSAIGSTGIKTTNATPGKIKISLRVRGEDEHNPSFLPLQPHTQSRMLGDSNGRELGEEDDEDDDESVSSITSSTIPYRDSPGAGEESEGSEMGVEEEDGAARLRANGGEGGADDEDEDDDEDEEEDDDEEEGITNADAMVVSPRGVPAGDGREDEPPIRLSVKGIGTDDAAGPGVSIAPGVAPGTGPKVDTARGDDSASELTQISDDSDREDADAMSEDDPDAEAEADDYNTYPDDWDERQPQDAKWAADQRNVASVPPPNTKSTSRPPTSSSNNQTSSNNSSAAKPLSSGGPVSGTRKPSIFGSRSDEPEIPEDDNESELTDSEAESTTATPVRPRVVAAVISNSTAEMTSEMGDGVSVDPLDPALDAALDAEGIARRLSTVGKPQEDEEKPYSPPKTAKKGILGRATEGEIESVMSEEEEDDDDEGGQGMLVKDAVRRESEGKAKQSQDDEDEDEDDKGVAGESASLEERAASPSSIKSKQRVSATPAPSSTSHMITNNLSSATTQTTLEALKSLLQIEVKFAALRDQLYVEKMDELSREEEVIADGSHPSLLHLHQILQDRRENLLHLAQLRLKQNELEIVRVRESDKKAVMSWWQDAKDTLVRDEYESNARKKRRLDKDKADYETVRPAPRALPPKMPARQDAEARTYAWEKGPSITALMADEVSTDLAKIGVAARSQYRHTHGRHPREAMPTYGRSGHGLGFTAEEQGLMVDTGSLMFDPTGGVNRPINGNSGHHHHHVVPAAVAPQAAPRHRQFATTPNVYDMHSQLQPRREGRQVPTSNAEPFDPRRRDRMDESVNALGGPSRDRSRRDIEDGRDPKRRKTDSNSPAPLNGGGPPIGHQTQHGSASHRNGDHRMDVEARMQEERRQPRRSPSPKPNGQPNHGKAMHPESSLPPANGAPAGYGQPDKYGAGNNGDRRGWNYRWSGAGAGAVPRHAPGMAAARN